MRQGGTAVGTRSLTLQLVADAVGHFLDLRRQLLQVVFGLCGVTACEMGKPPWERPQDGDLGREGTRPPHSLCSGMGAERMML